MLFAGCSFLQCWLGPGMTLLQRLLKDEPRCQSTAVAFLLLCNSLVGALAPWAIGTWFDNGTAANLRKGLEMVLGVSYGASCICFMRLAHELLNMVTSTIQRQTLVITSITPTTFFKNRTFAYRGSRISAYLIVNFSNYLKTGCR